MTADGPARRGAGYRYGLAVIAVIAVTGAVAVLAGTRKRTLVRTSRT